MININIFITKDNTFSQNFFKLKWLFVKEFRYHFLHQWCIWVTDSEVAFLFPSYFRLCAVLRIWEFTVICGV